MSYYEASKREIWELSSNFLKLVWDQSLSTVPQPFNVPPLHKWPSQPSCPRRVRRRFRNFRYKYLRIPVRVIGRFTSIILWTSSKAQYAPKIENVQGKFTKQIQGMENSTLLLLSACITHAVVLCSWNGWYTTSALFSSFSNNITVC